MSNPQPEIDRDNGSSSQSGGLEEKKTNSVDDVKKKKKLKGERERWTSAGAWYFNESRGMMETLFHTRNQWNVENGG